VSDDREERWAARLERERRARRQAERIAEHGMRELWAANQTLEERVRERTQELENSLAALAEASRLRQLVLEQLSHELATPLHAVRAGLELIDGDALPADDAARLLEVRAAAERLDGVLQALLAVSQASLRDGGHHAETRRPSELLDGIEATWQRPAARRGMLLVTDLVSSEVPVEAPWRLLDIALASLIDALVQHGRPGPIHITAALEHREHDTAATVCVTLRDAGPPVPEETLAIRPPTPLTWAGAGRRGIGMALVQRLADESSMEMQVSNLPDGSGTEVVLRLPGTAGL
jgi:signal transduction histidine kinase